MQQTPSPRHNLQQRVVTGLLGAGVIVSSLLLGQISYFIIFFLICFLALKEFYDLIEKDGQHPLRNFGMLSGMVLYSLSFMIEKQWLPFNTYFAFFPFLSIAFLVKLYSKGDSKPFTSIAFTMLGLLYVAVPISLLHVLTMQNGHYNFEIVFGCMLIMWISDTGAYFIGSRFGRSKLFERVSPKKTWEGFIAGILLGLLLAYLISGYFLSITRLDWLVVGTILTIGGTIGDLVESLLKRSIQIKDSGSSLPGHGGFLDRFDGLLLSLPFIVAYLEIFRIPS